MFSAPLHATVTWRSPGCSCGGRLFERPVLHHEPAGEHGCEHGRARDDAERDEREPLSARRQPGGHEAQREGEAAKLRHRYSHYTGVEDPMSPRYDVPNAAPAPCAMYRSS